MKQHKATFLMQKGKLEGVTPLDGALIVHCPFCLPRGKVRPQPGKGWRSFGDDGDLSICKQKPSSEAPWWYQGFAHRCEISGEREVGRCGLGAGAQRPALNAIALWPPPTLCESLLPVSRGATHGSRILVSGGERTASRVRARCPGPTH